MKELKPNFEMEEFAINKKSVNLFVINQLDRRRVRNGEVRSLLSSIEKGTHFGAPFVVNDTDGKLRLIDGNHRFEAIRMAIKKNENFEIKIWMAVYKNLSEDKEKDVYRLWNTGTAQTATDFLKVYFRSIPLGQEMLKRLPVNIYGDEKHIPIKQFVGAHIEAKRQKKFSGGYSGNKTQTLMDFSEVELEDIKTLEQFYIFMKKVFGEYYKGNNFYRSTPIGAFYRIWYDNRKMPEEKLVKKFKKVFAEFPERWNNWTSHGGRSASITMYTVSLEALNRLQGTKLQSDKDLVNDEKK